MKRKLKTLEEHNKKKLGNGIECPLCGEELRDSSSQSIFCSCPEKYEIFCPAEDCKYVGTRF
jgi:hypothetical protein